MFSKLMSQSLVAFFFRLLSALLGFAVAGYITNNLGAKVAGDYFYIISWMLVAISICSLGLQNYILKVVAKTNDNLEINSLVNLASLYIILASILLSIIVMAIWASFKYFIDIKYSLFLVLLFCISFLLLSLTAIYAHALQGKQKVSVSIFCGTVLQPLIFMSSIYVGIPNSLDELFLYYVFSCILTCFIVMILWSVYNPFKFIIPKDKGGILYSCSSILIFQVIQQINGSLGNFVLGIDGTSEEIAFFSIALRIALLTSFVTFAVNRVTSPIFSQLYSEGNRKKLEQAVSYSKLIILLLALPMLLLAFLFPEEVLSLFGHEFIQAVNILRVLVVIQVFAVFGGSLSYLLIMTNNEDSLRNNVMLSLLLSIVLTIITYNFTEPMVSAIIAFGTSVIANTIFSSYAVWKVLRINVFNLWTFNYEKK